MLPQTVPVFLCGTLTMLCACTPPPAMIPSRAQTQRGEPVSVSTASAAGLPPTAGLRPSTAAYAGAAPSTAPAGLRLVSPDEWPTFEDNLDKRSLLKAADKSAAYLEKIAAEKRFYRVGDREIAAGELLATLRALAQTIAESKDGTELNARLRRDYELYQSAGSDGAGKVVFSSYYQPILRASLKRTPKYRYPLYRRPRDMVDVDLGLFNSKWRGEAVLGRVTKDGKVVPYFDRRDIDILKTLAGKGLEVAWLENQFDRLDLHIQGSGILKLTNGKKALAKYAATNALTYKSVGSVLVNSGAIPKSEINHARLRQYLAEHPEVEAWLLAQNPRYTFFDLVPLPEDGEPFGTIQQSLVPGRSIAIDPAVIPLGAVAYFQTPMPQTDRGGNLLGIFPSSRFAFCQDTGGAILGPGRVDIYLGSGAQAKNAAVNQWAEGKLYILLKKIPARER